MAFVVAVEIVLPLVLLIWLVLLPASSRIGLAAQAAGTGAFLLARGSSRTKPVWWLPYVYGALFQWPPAVGAPPIWCDPLALRIDGRFLVHVLGHAAELQRRTESSDAPLATAALHFAARHPAAASVLPGTARASTLRRNIA